ncbi:LysM peptidoglycan-binding domain-containing protein [Bacillus sp. HMF5848]|uniref:LysM peptidoglycan-binding domain-containing M23 family metallopeptidase n=1 Tax=Bacillus sp. HMF5848 TaxID=2495421 RepID=UPI000F7971C8|nr:LysM peptidoglycan-binding domain-containing M23 family metallopeptidase [Bacillus sp. HMF5848]RSK26127.1 LysM peptidoglycan-binding domain-containing protein [Bacillus sp. HMF5848]
MKRKVLLSTILALGLMGGTSVSADHTTSYTIQSGDTFWTLSQKFNVSYADILAVNPDANPYNLYIGLRVQIPVNHTDKTYDIYIIQSGDTFWTLSQKFDVPYSDILAANPTVNPYNLIIGQTVNIPKKEVQPPEGNTNTYVIQPGDTFWVISQKLNIPYTELLAANPNANPYNLYPGLVIQLPAKNTESVNAPASYADGYFPLKPGSYQPFTNTYGDGRTYNEDGTLTRKHEGIDMIAPIGTPVYSVYDGVVINKGWNTYGGWRLTVKTPDGKTAFYYAHMSKYAPNVEIGSNITKGQLIGYVGDTGYGPEGTSGQFVAHLHLGMYDITNGYTAVNPFYHLKYWETLNN